MGLFSRFKKSTPTNEDDVRADEEFTDDDELDAPDADTDTEDADTADDEVDEADASESDDDIDEEEALLEKSAPFDRSENGPFDISE